jgi:hypothetical protein
MSDQKSGRAVVSDRDRRYDGIEGGASPSPFTSIFLVIAFACGLAGAAVGDTMGETGPHLWDLAAITGVIAFLMTAFAPSGE